MSAYQEYVKRKRTEYGDRFDDSELSSQFVPYFENQKRIEVVSVSGTRRGRVGITTGWRPTFLLMLRSTSIGSQYILRDNDRIVKEI